MTTTRFKVGDKVRRTGESMDGGKMVHGEVYTVSDVRASTLHVEGSPFGYSTERFELVEIKVEEVQVPGVMHLQVGDVVLTAPDTFDGVKVRREVPVKPKPKPGTFGYGTNPVYGRTFGFVQSSSSGTDDRYFTFPHPDDGRRITTAVPVDFVEVPLPVHPDEYPF